MGMEKKAETWYVPPCITAFLYHFLQFSEEPARSRMHPFWWQKHQKGRKKGHACRVRLVKTVGPFFFGLIFSGPFVTWSVKDLVSHQFGTINSCMMKWCAQKSFKLITQIRATRWIPKTLQQYEYVRNCKYSLIESFHYFYLWDTLRFVGVKKEWPHHIDQDDDVVGDLIITWQRLRTAYWHFFSLHEPSLPFSSRAKAP